jgi:hypothetical protein
VEVEDPGVDVGGAIGLLGDVPPPVVDVGEPVGAVDEGVVVLGARVVDVGAVAGGAVVGGAVVGGSVVDGVVVVVDVVVVEGVTTGGMMGTVTRWYPTGTGAGRTSRYRTRVKRKTAAMTVVERRNRQ